MRRFLLWAALYLLALPAFSQTKIDYNTQIRNKPILAGTPVPSSCTIAGNFFFDTATGILYACDGAHYNAISGPGVTSGATLPTTCAIQGTLFFVTTAQRLYACNGTFYVPTSPYPELLASDFAFTTPSFGVTLTAGIPATVTIPLSPIGVNGTDTFHPLYIPGTNAESVIITGGTCASAAINCTLQFTPTNNHAAGWRFMSADVGINEALQVCATAGGGIVQLPAGTITLHGLMDQKTKCSKIGQGMDTTILQVAAGEFAAVQGWRAPEYGYVVDRAASGAGVTRMSYSIDMQGSTQTSVPTNTGAVVEWFNQQESPAQRVGILHSPNPANFLPFLMLGTSANNIIEFSKVIDDPLTGCTNTGAGGYFIQTSGAGNQVLHSYGEAGCQAMFQAGTSAAAGVYAYNTYNIGATTMSAFGQQFDADSSGPGWKFVGNTVIGNGTSPNCFAAISDDPVVATTDVSFADNDCLNAGVGYQVAGQGNTIITKNVSITGGHVTSPSQVGVLLQDGINGVSIANLQIDGHFSTPNGIFANSQISGGIKNITIGSGTVLRNMMSAGIHLTGAAGITPIDGLNILGATVTGNAVGLNLPSATPIGHFNISSNSIWENTLDYSFGISGGAAALVQLGVGTFGPNVTSSAPTLGLAAIQQGSHGTPFAAAPLLNGLNSNVSSSLQGSVALSGPTGAYSVGGFTNPYDGQELFVFNATTQTLTIVNEDASSTAANRIYTFTNANVVLTPVAGQNSQFTLKYSIAKGRWLLVSHS